MTEHLRECWSKHESDPPAWCICDELRDCEERMLNAAREAVLSAVATKTTVVMQTRYEDGMDLDDEYDTGWRDGMKCALGVSLTNIDALRSKEEEGRSMIEHLLECPVRRETWCIWPGDKCRKCAELRHEREASND